VLATVARHLHATVTRQAEQPFAHVLREYDAHHALIGRNVTVLNGDAAAAVSGRCEGLDEMGRLLLRSRSTLHRIISGHVRAD
jgi:biotin-(acetyl-CoA carboxylase) ligase